MSEVKGSNYGRPADSQRLIAEEIRAQIVAGKLPAGGRIPTRLDLERHYGAGSTTIQRALEVLSRDGFIESKGRNGTFVVENPPHLTRYGIVFFASAQDFARNNRYNFALSNQVRQLRHEQPDLKIAEYFGVDGHEDSEDYQRLVREVRAHRVAGLIFSSNEFPLWGTPVLQEPGLPRIVITPHRAGMTIPVVNLDTESFFVRALEDLRAEGRRRIAFLNPPLDLDWRARLAPLMREFGMETRPFWWQTVSPQTPEAAQNAAHLLMRCEERPDALVIGNDNLLEYATAGLVASGARVPEELSVISHCNFPYPTPSALPVKRLGYDARRVLRTCIESIDRQRNGEPVPAVTNIPAEFEHELPSAPSHGRESRRNRVRRPLFHTTSIAGAQS